MIWRVPFDVAADEIVQRALAANDPVAADHLRAFATARGDDALRTAAALANHVLGVDTVFEWTSDRS